MAALGTPGGDQQDQWQLLYLLRTLVGGYSPQQAIDAPAFHTTSMAVVLAAELDARGVVVEDRLGDEVIAELPSAATGSPSRPWRSAALGGDPGPGHRLLAAAANPRGAQGYAAGR